MPINLTRKSLNADYTGNYFQNTILFDFIKYNNIKKYATLVIAYLKRSFEEKSFHFFYWSGMIIQDNSYNKVFKSFVLSL